MAGTADRTQDAPVRRMAVARGTLKASDLPVLDDALRGVATAAALVAVKQSPLLLPHSDAFQPTHIDVLLDAADEGLRCTVTVQAHARAPLGQAALLGVHAALVALTDGASGAIETELVQSVTG